MRFYAHLIVLLTVLVIAPPVTSAEHPNPYFVQNSSGAYDIYIGDRLIASNCKIEPDMCAWKGRYVYADQRGGNTDIYLFDEATGIERRITAHPSIQKSPWISGDCIVYADNRNHNWDIYLFDLSTGIESQITKDQSHQYRPSICGSIIAWQDTRNGNYEIYMYDLNQKLELPVAVGNGLKLDPTVSQRQIAWRDTRAGFTEIYVFDVDSHSEKRIVGSRHNIIKPVICGQYVHWVAYYNNLMRVHRADISTGEISVVPTESNMWLAATGDRIVFLSRETTGGVKVHAMP